MFNRRGLNYGVWIGSVLALLAGVTSSSIRVPRPGGIPTFPGSHHDTIAAPRSGLPRVSAASIDSPSVLVKDLPAESEEDLKGTTRPSHCAFDPFPTVALYPEWILVPSALNPVFQPLRC